MEKIKIDSHVKYRLVDLIDILYYKEYFGFKEDAVKYVKDIYTFIYSIPKQRRNKKKNAKLGTYYCRYKYNRQTTYYISFDVENELYFIRNITNNHSPDYPEFISG